VEASCNVPAGGEDGPPRSRNYGTAQCRSLFWPFVLRICGGKLTRAPARTTLAAHSTMDGAARGAGEAHPHAQQTLTYAGAAGAALAMGSPRVVMGGHMGQSAHVVTTPPPDTQKRRSSLLSPLGGDGESSSPDHDLMGGASCPGHPPTTTTTLTCTFYLGWPRAGSSRPPTTARSFLALSVRKRWFVTRSPPFASVAHTRTHARARHVVM
jgi:hypothetical protein